MGHSGTHVGIIWEREGSKNVVNSSVYWFQISFSWPVSGMHPATKKPLKETTKPLHWTVFFWIRCWTQEEEIIKRHSFNSGSAKKQDKSWTKDEYNCHSLQTEIVFRKTHTICFLSRKISCSQYSFRFWNKRTLTFFPFQTICDCQTCRLRATYNLVELLKRLGGKKALNIFFHRYISVKLYVLALNGLKEVHYKMDGS